MARPRPATGALPRGGLPEHFQALTGPIRPLAAEPTPAVPTKPPPKQGNQCCAFLGSCWKILRRFPSWWYEYTSMHTYHVSFNTMMTSHTARSTSS